jgi:Amidohydrolase
MLCPFPAIDAHSHLPLDDDATRAVAEELGLRIVNICVDSKELGGLDSQRGWYLDLIHAHPKSFGWCTSFSLEAFGAANWADRAIAQLDRDFGDGAIACKVWKNVGMDLRDPVSGAYVLVDDERFNPVFAYLQKIARPLLMHIGEPMACWSALDPASPHYAYYSKNPQWHWHGRSDVPSHPQLMAARDRVIERFARLTVIGAHFGSLESDFTALAERFDRYPNFFVDTSARLGDVALLARRDYNATKEFFIRYADRILWGIDWVVIQPTSQLPLERREQLQRSLRHQYELEWRFYSTDDELLIDNRPTRGLKLSADVLKRTFADTARRIYFEKSGKA